MRTVEIWHAELAQPPELVRRLERLLTDAERERAARLAAASRWIAARAALRLVLAGRLAVAPGAVELAAGPHGKPHVPGSRVRFNLSHSGDLALVALTEDEEVGIDLERTARRSAAVERALTAGERAALRPGDRHTELLRIWCRKEAMAKAGGGGLGWAPETFDTTRPGALQLVDLDPGEGYVGALAVHGGQPVIAHHRVTF